MKLFPMQAKLFARCSSDDVIRFWALVNKQGELAEWSTLRRALRVNETAREEADSSISTQDSAHCPLAHFVRQARRAQLGRNSPGPYLYKPLAANTERSDVDHLLEIHLKRYM